MRLDSFVDFGAIVCLLTFLAYFLLSLYFLPYLFTSLLVYFVTYLSIITSSSAVADKPSRHAASRQTAKFQNSHVTITTSLLWVICHHVARIDIAYLCIKFDDFRFSRSTDMIGDPKMFNGSHDLTTSLSGTVCRP